MQSAYSATQGFDWLLLSRVLCIIQIVMICQLRALNSYIYVEQDQVHDNFNALFHPCKLFIRKSIKISITFDWLMKW
jgi:hypothetical protein